MKIVVAAAVGFAMMYLGARDHLHRNTSASLPVVWDWASVTYTVARGDLVELCPPDDIDGMARDREYVQEGPCPGGTVPFLKLVAAVAGDRVRIDARGISVNGRLLPNSVAHHVDPHGRPLPVQPHGERVLERGDVWLYGSDGWSLDSRYFGPVSAATIHEHAIPLVGAKLPDLR